MCIECKTWSAYCAKLQLTQTNLGSSEVVDLVFRGNEGGNTSICLINDLEPISPESNLGIFY